MVVSGIQVRKELNAFISWLSESHAGETMKNLNSQSNDLSIHATRHADRRHLQAIILTHFFDIANGSSGFREITEREDFHETLSI